MRGYRFAVQWIVDNEGSVNDIMMNEDREPRIIFAVSGLIPVALVADLFGKTQAQVAADVIRVWRKPTR